MTASLSHHPLSDYSRKHKGAGQIDFYHSPEEFGHLLCVVSGEVERSVVRPREVDRDIDGTEAIYNGINDGRYVVGAGYIPDHHQRSGVAEISDIPGNPNKPFLEVLSGLFFTRAVVGECNPCPAP